MVNTNYSLFFLTSNIVFLCSAVEQPDVVFSIEQIRCGKTESHSTALASEDCGTSDICDSDPDSECLTSSSQADDECSNSSSAEELFFKLKEQPEELLQLAPEAGDAIVPLTGGEPSQRYSY